MHYCRCLISQAQDAEARLADTQAALDSRIEAVAELALRKAELETAVSERGAEAAVLRTHGTDLRNQVSELRGQVAALRAALTEAQAAARSAQAEADARAQEAALSAAAQQRRSQLPHQQRQRGPSRESVSTQGMAEAAGVELREVVWALEAQLQGAVADLRAGAVEVARLEEQVCLVVSIHALPACLVTNCRPCLAECMKLTGSHHNLGP